MESYIRKKTEPGIDFAELFRRLVRRWKSMLLVAIIVGVALAMVAYHRDSGEYKQFMSEVEQMQEDILSEYDSQLVDYSDRTKLILASLDKVDRIAVENILRREALLEEQREVLQTSIYFNTDAENERTITLSYIIESADPEETHIELAKAYMSSTRNQELCDNLGKVLSVDEEGDPLIAQLITTEIEEKPLYAGSGFYFRIIVPEDVDAEQISSVVTDYLKKQTPELSKATADHEIKLMNASDQHRVDADLLQKKTDWTNRISDQAGFIKKAKAELTGEQITAYNLIKEEEKATEEIEEDGVAVIQKLRGVQTPHIRLKYGIVGFLLGLIGYAGLFMLLVLMRGKVYSPILAEEALGAGMLGVSENGSCPDSLDEVISAVSNRNNTDHITILRTYKKNAEGDDYTDILVDRLKAKGIKADIADEDQEGGLIYAELAPLVVCIREDVTSNKTLASIRRNCSNFALDILGFVFCR